MMPPWGEMTHSMNQQGPASDWIPRMGEDEHLREAASRFGLELLRQAMAPPVMSTGLTAKGCDWREQHCG